LTLQDKIIIAVIEPGIKRKELICLGIPDSVSGMSSLISRHDVSSNLRRTVEAGQMPRLH